ncbi:14908_t:CDS:1, partial [Entrophospora sp. SA101]
VAGETLSSCSLYITLDKGILNCLNMSSMLNSSEVKSLSPLIL